MAEVLSPFDGVDFETADLILKLQLEDVEDLLTSSKGKQRDGELDDPQFALSLLESNLECVRSIISDRQMTQSIATAIRTDGTIIANTIREEEAACGDHTLAHRLNGTDVTSEVQLEQNALNEKILSKLAGLYMFADSGVDILGGDHEPGDCTSTAESSGQASKRPQSSEFTCDACHERKRYFDGMEATCGHGYCKGCLQVLFDLSTKDESLFPPRCCRTPIDLEEAQIFLTKELKDRFDKAKVEFSSPDRTYCSRESCSAFIPGEQVSGDTATCPDCGTETCVMCKGGSHDGDCPDDTALHQTLAAAEENGWQRCYSCRRLIELDVGCNHMTCRCGAQFCYVCGVPWKGCACDQ
ncbi:hypothetical protein, variant [Exophiala sideris]|uniref:RBR-type E3 ubiquitin transferase n=1 Tax=Exophiala sideris TaxID=1016849 RepID=A0A0D1Y5F8_9EURO|nr:hypothetical protein, variant [Exophiala sideris]